MKRKKESSRNLHWNKWNAYATEGDNSERKRETKAKTRKKV